jgi:urease accessory protein UreF
MVQLMDIAPESGGYTDCFQIENLIASDRLRHPAELERLLITALKHGIGPLDGFAAGAVFDASRHGDFARLPALVEAMCRSEAPLSLQQASLATGEYIWEVSRRWPWAQTIHQQLDGVTRQTGHFHAVAFGALISDATAQKARAVAACLMAAAKSLVFCAAKYLPMDLNQSQRVLNDVQPTITQLAIEYTQPDAAALPPREPTAIIAEFSAHRHDPAQ